MKHRGVNHRDIAGLKLVNHRRQRCGRTFDVKSSPLWGSPVVPPVPSRQRMFYQGPLQVKTARAVERSFRHHLFKRLRTLTKLWI